MSLPPGSAVAIPVLAVAVAVAFSALWLVGLAPAGPGRLLPRGGWGGGLFGSAPCGGRASLIFREGRAAAAHGSQSPAAAEGGGVAERICERSMLAEPGGVGENKREAHPLRPQGATFFT